MNGTKFRQTVPHPCNLPLIHGICSLSMEVAAVFMGNCYEMDARPRPALTKSLFSMDEEGHPFHGSRCSVNGVHQLSLSSGQSPRGALKKIERQMFPEILMRMAYTVCQLLAAQLLGFSSADCAARVTYVDARALPSVAWVNKKYDFS